jgi:2-methylfumaryl-CoA hydratase
MSLARALSFNGLANAFHIVGINAGRHVAPLFAGGTVFAWSEIVDKAAHGEVGALRIVTRATRDLPCTEFPVEYGTAEKPGVILELDYWTLIPR